MDGTSVIVVGADEGASPVSEILRQRGFEVQVAACLDGLPDAIRKSDPDCVLLDFSLMGSDPAGLVTHLRSLDHLHGSALVFLAPEPQPSASSNLDPFSLCVDDYLTRSISPDEFAARLRAAIMRRRFLCQDFPHENRYLEKMEQARFALQEILSELSRFKNLGRCSIALLEEERQSAHVVASSDAPPSAQWFLDLADYPELIEVSRTGSPLVVSDVRTSPLMAPVVKRLDPAGFRSLLVVPVQADGRVVGAMVLRFHEPDPDISAEDFFFCRLMAILFARLLGSAVEDQGLAPVAEAEAGARERFSRHREEFTITALHALRTPVAAIHGFGSLLRESCLGQLDCDQRDYLEKVIAHCEELNGLLCNILDLSRLISGRHCLEVAPRDLGTLLRSVYKKTWSSALRRGLLFQWDLPTDPCYALFETAGIQQILCGLLEDAIERAPLGSTLYVQVEDGDEYMSVLIEDHGGSADDEDRGLHLTLYRAIMEAHQGRLDVRPAEGGRRRTQLFLRKPPL
jgi:signal transduction histidine kinase/DNA-binding response OmpR family regulator